MRFSTAMVALVAGMTAAAPTYAPIQKRSYTFDRVATGPAAKRNVVAAMKKAYAKYNMEMPTELASMDESLWDEVKCEDDTVPAGSDGSSISSPSGSNSAAIPANVPNASSNKQSGTVVTTPTYGDAQYNVVMNISGQSFNMDFDTGSSDLWVFSNALPKNEMGTHSLYNSAQDPNFKQTPKSSFAVSYGDGSKVSGNVVGTTTVTIGGVNAVDQTIELADSVSTSLASGTSDGLVGLAFDNINNVKPKPVSTFLGTIMNTLPQPIMTANLKHNTPGSYSFGEIDETAFQGQLTKVPINSKDGFWSFQSNTFSVGDGPVQKNGGGKNTIADTGTTLLLTDKALATAYWKQVSGSKEQAGGAFIFPCNAQLPDLHLAVGSGMATIPGALLNFGGVSGTSAIATGSKTRRRRSTAAAAEKRDMMTDLEALEQELTSNGNTQSVASQPQQMCSGALGYTSGEQIFGDIFFKAVFVVFNRAEPSLSFAPHA